VDAYQSNVDLLSGRTSLGKFLFQKDASILLHSVIGGQVTVESDTDRIQMGDLTTRWTLQFTFHALPWKPVARFSGISQYQLQVVGDRVQVTKQTDYWDSINLVSDGTGQTYHSEPKSVVIKHFLSQILKPAFELYAISAGPELPYQVLRVGRLDTQEIIDGPYEVRRYPAFVAIQIPYTRRDEGFERLGTLTKGTDAIHGIVDRHVCVCVFILCTFTYLLK
jgi:hypothetical protein